MPDEFVVMPNHFHGIVRLVNVTNGPEETSGGTSLQKNIRTSLPSRQQQLGRGQKQSPRLRPKSVSSFMAGIKSVITKRINEFRNTPGARVLQYGFYDHIIRNEQELFCIRQYIINNPTNWKQDSKNDSKKTMIIEPSVQ